MTNRISQTRHKSGVVLVGQEIGQWVAGVGQDAIACVGLVYVASQLGVEIGNFVLQADALVNTEVVVEQALLQV